MTDWLTFYDQLPRLQQLALLEVAEAVQVPVLMLSFGLKQ